MIVLQAHTEIKIDGVWHSPYQPLYVQRPAIVEYMMREMRGLPDDFCDVTRSDIPPSTVVNASWYGMAEMTALHVWLSDNKIFDDSFGYVLGNRWMQLPPSVTARLIYWVHHRS